MREFWKRLDSSWKFALVAYFVVRVALSTWSLLIVFLFPILVQNLDLFGTPVLGYFDLISGKRYAYSRQVDGTTLTFRAGDDGMVVDNQSSSVWSLRDGHAVSGKYIGNSLASPSYSIEEIFPYRGVTPSQNLLLSAWQRFDVNWYLAIAERGYGTIDGDVHFPPLYPVLIRFGETILGNDYWVALVISNLATMACLATLYQMVRALFDSTAAARTVVYLLIFPTAFFFFAAYTEPLFLLAALWALRMLRQGSWHWSGLWIFCAILLRLQGVALLLPLGYAVWKDGLSTNRLQKLVGLALPATSGILYLAIRFLVGDPSIVPISETNLHARLVFPWDNVLYAIQTLAPGKFILVDLMNLLFTAIAVIVLAGAWRKMPMVFNLYMAASLIVLTMRIVETQPLNSMTRYVSTLFPMFIALANWGEKSWVNRGVVYLWFPLQLYLSAQFVLWGWVG